MIIIFHTFIEILYYLFIAFIIVQYNSFSMISSAWIIMTFSLLVSTILFLLIYFIKDRKQYFIISSIYIILICSIFHIFGENILNIFNLRTGITNFTMYIFKILFMLSPFFSLYFLGIHKLIYNKQKKQLYLIIALKRLIPIVFMFIIISFSKFSTILYFNSIIELILNFLPYIRKNKKLH